MLTSSSLASLRGTSWHFCVSFYRLTELSTKFQHLIINQSCVKSYLPCLQSSAFLTAKSFLVAATSLVTLVIFISCFNKVTLATTFPSTTSSAFVEEVRHTMPILLNLLPLLYYYQIRPQVLLPWTIRECHRKAPPHLWQTRIHWLLSKLPEPHFAASRDSDLNFVQMDGALSKYFRQ